MIPKDDGVGFSRGTYVPPRTNTSRAPNSIIEMLGNKGWSTPARAPEPTRKPEDFFKVANTRVLTPYAYAVSEDEWNLITDKYRNTPGFAAPEREPRTVPVRAGGPGGWNFTFRKPAPNPEQAEQERIDARAPMMNPGLYTEAQLGWDEYGKLTEPQRARVDFTTAFVNAREKDLHTPVKPSDEQRALHDKQVAEMFGPNGGSVVYAPEVVALLKQVDFKALGQDLDEYLSLERLTDISDLKGATFNSAKVKQLGDSNVSYKDIRSEANLAALDAQVSEKSSKKFSELMQDGYQILQDWHATAAVSRGGDVESYGGVMMSAPPGTEPIAGFPTAIAPGAQLDLNDIEVQRGLFHSSAYDTLLRSDSSFNDLVKMAEENEFTKADWSKLINYIDIRTRQQERWGIPTPNEAGTKVREADEIRALVGLED